ncbi:MAG: hypothetical protein FJY07_11985, partial [Bacteroidetes bacterium]|nr:hypothetical protein [Bacteroidota bacterium]
MKPIQVISVGRLVYYAVLAVFIVSISDPAMGQEALLYKTISLKVTDQPLEKVLEKITGQTGINFSYNSRIITGINIT